MMPKRTRPPLAREHPERDQGRNDASPPAATAATDSEELQAMPATTKKKNLVPKSKRLKKRQIARRAQGVSKPGKEAPLAQVKRMHGSKEALIDTLTSELSSKLGEDRDQTRQRLMNAPNSKLLRLHAAVSRLTEEFGGSKDRLIDAVSKSRGHGNDKDYATKLQSFPVTRLLDMARAKA